MGLIGVKLGPIMVKIEIQFGKFLTIVTFHTALK